MGYVLRDKKRKLRAGDEKTNSIDWEIILKKVWAWNKSELKLLIVRLRSMSYLWIRLKRKRFVDKKYSQLCAGSMRTSSEKSIIRN